MEKIQGTPLIEVLRDDSMSQDFVKNALISCGSAVEITPQSDNTWRFIYKQHSNR